MLPNDAVYNLLKDFKLPISSDEKSLTNFIEKHFKTYEERIDNLFDETKYIESSFYEELKDSKNKIEEICETIIRVLRFYDEAHILEAHDLYFKLLDKYKDSILTRQEKKDNRGAENRYYRIRTVDQEKKFERKDLFHISFEDRNLITSYRYSIAGFPCLYLASSPRLAWFECGMPQKFMMSEFRLSETFKEEAKLIDFSLDPIEISQWLHLAYLNEEDDKKRIGHKIILDYLVTYPIKMVCSLVVRNKNVKFIHEYVIPQMTLLWIKKHKDFSGIAYQSSSNYEDTYVMREHNLAIPSKEIKDDKYCGKLTSKYEVSNPKYLEVRSLISENEDEINSIREFLYSLTYFYEREFSMNAFRDMISICKTFLKICDNLKSENYNDGETFYQAIDTLNLYCYLLIDNKETLIKNAINNKKLIVNYKEEELKSKIDGWFLIFESEVKNKVFDFWNYDFKLMASFEVSDSDFSRI